MKSEELIAVKRIVEQVDGRMRIALRQGNLAVDVGASEWPCIRDAALTALQDKEAVVRELPPFDEVVRRILGTPCFAVIQVAHAMRLRGFDIPRKAEEEQAAVAYFKLQMYMKYGKEWEQKGVEELNAMPKVEPK